MNFQECSWPDLSEPYSLALQQAVEFIAVHFDPVGILACGSILRGTPDPSSDLDMYVIHHRPLRQRIQKTFNGVPAEIFVNPPAEIGRYFQQEQAARRPITAHMLATGFVVYQSDSTVDDLRARAADLLVKAPPIDDAQCVYNRYMAATLYEDALDVVERDPDTANMLLGQAVSAMLTYIFHERGLFIPRSKDLLNRVSELDAGLGKAARRFFAAGLLADRLTWAEKVADSTIQTHGFFEWESAPEELSEQ